MVPIRPDLAINPRHIVKIYKITCDKEKPTDMPQNPHQKIGNPGIRVYYPHPKGAWENEWFFASEEERDAVFFKIISEEVAS